MRLESLVCRRSASRWRGEGQPGISSRARPAQPERVEKVPCEDAFMVNSNEAIRCMNDDDLIYYTREIVRRGCEVEADLLLHLAEIDGRGLYRNRAFPSMFAFCVVELGFSEDAAYNRITVARAARRLPAIFDAVRSGQIHLSGLRVLLPHLTDENHEEVLAQAAAKSKREIEELGARLAPKPPLPPGNR